MPSLDKPLRNQLERTVKDARDVAETAVRSALEQLGVGEANPPLHLSNDERDLRRRLRIHGRQLGDAIIDEPSALAPGVDISRRALAPGSPGPRKGTQTIERLIEESAYEHWHRMLPQIFRVDSPVFEIQLPPEHQQQLEKLISGLPVDVFRASDSLGWTYQFWQARRKEQVNESGVKIGAREPPSVTQLFTEDYMVDFLLDNRLGAWHAGKILSTSPMRKRGIDSLANAAGYEAEGRTTQHRGSPGMSLDLSTIHQGESSVFSVQFSVFSQN